jgi:hypothetical protein
MYATLLARAATLTAAVVSGALLTAVVTVLPVPAHAELYPAAAIAGR